MSNAYKVVEAQTAKELVEKLNELNIIEVIHVQPKPHAGKLGYEVILEVRSNDERQEEV